MKKIIAAAWVALLCLGLLIYSVVGREPVEKPSAESTAQTSQPQETSEPATQPEPEPARVCFLNKDPQRQAVWEALAAEFTLQSGVEVTVVSDAAMTSGADQRIPTLFSIRAPEEAEQLSCLELSDTVAYAQLAAGDFALTSHGTVCGIASQVEPYGLIYNTSLLARAGYTGADIQSFGDLKAVAQYITANRETLEFDAFAALDSQGEFAGLLSAVPEPLGEFWALYSENISVGDLYSRSAVFGLGTVSDMEALMDSTHLQLEMLPLYTGSENQENRGLCAIVTGYWCIRADAPEQDIRGALAFLNYLVNPRTDGTVPVDDLGLLAPYRQAAFGENTAELLFRSQIASGKEIIVCKEKNDTLTAALKIYAAAPTEENRAAVAKLLEE